MARAGAGWLSDVPMLALEASRLEESRLAALEGRIEADLALGRHHELPGELEELVAGYPARERFWCQLAMALYRNGRQADALAACRRARDYLSAELGLDPGEDLRRLEQAVLRQDVPGPQPRQRGNLPSPLTGFLGREHEMAELGLLLGSARIVTLTGTGGVGKTRLAVEIATQLAGGFAGGVWLADLAGIASPGLVPSKVMEALGVRQTGEVPAAEALTYRLRSAELLLVLDNCEHLLGACAALAGMLLAGSPGLRMLATSREPLGVAGEVVYVVPPLAVPPESAGERALAQSAAVRLFTERASAARAVSHAQVPVLTAARICRELDGLPLAIELAAARASSLSAGEIADRLADRFALLAYRRPVTGARHQALKDAIGWSYDLLAEDEARVLAGLSVFAGGFELGEVASACCGGDDTAALDVIDALAAKSLLVIHRTGGRTRYQLLETIRQYAAGRLAGAGQQTQARRRHAAAFADLAAREHDLAVLAREHDNFRAALEWSLSRGERQCGLQLALALGDFWLAHGLLDEARGSLERAVGCAPDDLARGRVLRLLGAAHYQAGDAGQAQEVLSEGAIAAQAAGDAATGARIRVLLAEIHCIEGIPSADDLAACDAAAAQLEADNDLAGLAGALLAAGILQIVLGDGPAAAQALRRAADYARQGGNHHAEVEAISWLVVSFQTLAIPVGDAISRSESLLETAAGNPWAEATILQPLALLYAFAGRFGDARTAIEHSQAIFTRSGSALNAGACGMLAGHIEMIAGNPAGAEHVLTEARDALQAQEQGGYLPGVLAWLAEAAYAQGRLSDAERLTEQTMAMAGATDLESRALPLATRAKILARRGNLSTATKLASEAVNLVAATTHASLLGYMLLASAEVSRLAGAHREAAATLQQALRIYENAQAEPLADRTRAALAGLTYHTSTDAALIEPAGQKPHRD